MKKRTRTKSYWQRDPIEEPTVVSLAEWRTRDKGRWEWQPSDDYPEVTLQGLLNKHGDAFTITLFLVNGQVEPTKRKDQAWLFQPEIIVETPDFQSAFIRRALPDGLAPTEVEDNIMRMIYRKQVEFAVGHGIAVHAELADERWEEAQRIRTEVLPRAEVLRMEPRPIADLTVDMRALAETEQGDFTPLLMPLVEDYALWIAERDAEIAQKPADLEPFETETAFVRAEWGEALERIRAGIALLDADADAARAFQFANRAMWQQRVRTIYSGLVRQEKRSRIWRMSICPRTEAGVPFSWHSSCSICRR